MHIKEYKTEKEKERKKVGKENRYPRTNRAIIKGSLSIVCNTELRAQCKAIRQPEKKMVKPQDQRKITHAWHVVDKKGRKGRRDHIAWYITLPSTSRRSTASFSLQLHIVFLEIRLISTRTPLPRKAPNLIFRQSTVVIVAIILHLFTTARPSISTFISLRVILLASPSP